MRRGAVQARLWAAGLWTLVLTPALVLLARTLGNRLGANPIEELTLELGQWALRFCC